MGEAVSDNPNSSPGILLNMLEAGFAMESERILKAVKVLTKGPYFAVSAESVLAHSFGVAFSPIDDADKALSRAMNAMVDAGDLQRYVCDVGAVYSLPKEEERPPIPDTPFGHVDEAATSIAAALRMMDDDKHNSQILRTVAVELEQFLTTEGDNE